MLVVADTSVILNLCFLGIEQILPPIFGDIRSTPVVHAEFERLAAHDERFHGLKFPVYITLQSPKSVLADLPDKDNLGAGEVSAISLALELHADRLPVDENEGRLSAMRLGLAPVGVLGIFIMAKKKRLIPDISPLLDRLVNEARFWIAPSLRRSVLVSAGEIAGT